MEKLVRHSCRPACAHPTQPAPDTNELHNLPPALEVTPDHVVRALRSFPAGTSPGPSGLRAQHLLEAAPAGTAAGFFEQLTRVVSLLAQGQACPAAAPVLAGAGLVAVPKANGGVRPIAIGEIFRRLTGKSLLQHIREEAQAFFYPAQVGVCVPLGAEVAIHTTRAWVARQANTRGKVVLKLDFHNAFNTVNRSAVRTTSPASVDGLTGVMANTVLFALVVRPSPPPVGSNRGTRLGLCFLLPLSNH